MKLSQQSLLLIENTIKQAMSKFESVEEEESNTVTDIHFQSNQISGELLISDDEDTELASNIVREWISYEADDFYKEIERILTSILTKLKRENAFNKYSIMEPYSFVLEDEEKETICDLLLMDNDTFIVNDELLKGLDEELDAFLENLLKK